MRSLVVLISLISTFRRASFLLAFLFGSIWAGAQSAVSIKLAWDPSPDPNIVGYKLYVGSASRTYSQTNILGLATTAVVTNLVRGNTYWFAVAALNSDGVESVPGGEVSSTANACPTAAPDVIDAVPNRTTRVPVAFLLRNDTDQDGDVLQLDSIDAVTQAAGTTVMSDGFIYYTPAAGFQGLDGLFYRVSDGHGHIASGNISVRVQPPTKPHIAPILSLPEQGGSVVVQFKAAPNLRFAVEASTDLLSWSLLGAAVSNEHGDVSFVDSQPASPSRFYRLSLP